ncbi:DUF541 domain-containing protein [bacterium]|nr:DUF541 domain-containing protein [bacterium]
MENSPARRLGPALAIALGMMATAWILGSAFKNRNAAEDSIQVTGLGSADFIADLVVWNATFDRRSMDLKSAYASIDQDREVFKQYLISKGVKPEQIVFSAISTEEVYEYFYNNNGGQSRTFIGYELRQTVTVESQEVDKVEVISREATELINQGLELRSESPEYYFTGLAELKVDLISKATEDARLRAENIAKSGKGRLGKLKSARMGVFQITAQNSSEDFSWGGTFNVSDKRKRASITVRLEYALN